MRTQNKPLIIDPTDSVSIHPNKMVKNNAIAKDVINFNEVTDTLKNLKINFKHFNLYIKSNEDPFAVEIENKELSGYRDDKNFYTKRDTILINYGTDNDSFIYGNRVEFSNKNKINNLKLTITFFYDVSTSFIDDIPGTEILCLSFTKELKIDGNMFLVIDDIDRNDE